MNIPYTSAECESLWPIGWGCDAVTNTTYATVSGVTVTHTQPRGWYVSGRPLPVAGDLRQQLTTIREYILALPRDIPPIKEPTLEGVLGQLLVPLGWARSNLPFTWHKGVWRISLLQDKVAMHIRGCAGEYQTAYEQLGPATVESVNQALIDLFDQLPRYP